MDNRDTASIVAETQSYYDGPADEIYRAIWGDNLHLGVLCNEGCPHPEAMEHTNEIMANAATLNPGVRVLDLGCGYAGSYAWVRDRLRESRADLLQRVDSETIDNTVAALSFWVDSANAGYIGWGFFVAQLPA